MIVIHCRLYMVFIALTTCRWRLTLLSFAWVLNTHLFENRRKRRIRKRRQQRWWWRRREKSLHCICHTVWIWIRIHTFSSAFKCVWLNVCSVSCINETLFYYCVYVLGCSVAYCIYLCFFLSFSFVYCFVILCCYIRLMSDVYKFNCKNSSFFR